MGTILALLIVAGAAVLIYRLVTHKEETPEQVAEPAKASSKKEPPKCGCGRSSTGYCVGLHKLSDAEWAISDKNPNRVAVAPVVVTADTPSAAVEAAPTPKKARAAKPKKAEDATEKPKKPKAKKAK